MAVEFKDYYKSLGVSRTATDDEIRKAFRKLARQYHPDVAGNKAGAEDKFKEINEAYEVLSDAEKRRKYDALGANWKQGSEFRPPPGWGGFSSGGAGRRGQAPPDFEFQGTGFSDFFEQIFGSMRGGPAGRAAGGGPRTGRVGGDEEFSQAGDDVEADIMVTLEEASEGSIRTISLRRTVPCPKCHGTGQVMNGRPCPVCNGTGGTEKTDTNKVKIPAGILEGQTLRVPGQGEPGIGSGPAGDLYLRIKFAKNPDFRVEGANLHYDLELAPWEAVLGTNISVPTLGAAVNIKIPPGTISGTKMRLRGRGLKTKTEPGDLIVSIRVQVPKSVSAGEKALWEALGRESKFNPRD